jgi:aerobic carbon-monoxide dehydrogenase medium subunit
VGGASNMSPFEYVAPASVDEALAVLGEHGGDAKVLAGGQSLIPMLNYRLAKPRLVVDINGLPLDGLGIAVGTLRLGALLRHAALEESLELARYCPVLREAAALIGNVRVRTLGTLGGSLTHADPAAELPMVMVALDAQLAVAGRAGRRTIAAGDFFTGPLTTALADDELLLGVEIPMTRDMGGAVEEVSRRAGDFAIVAITALVSVDRRGRIDEARLAVAGVGPAPRRVPAAEEILVGSEPTAEQIARAAEAARAAVAPESDAFVSAAYRRLLVGVLARRALSRAAARALQVR